MRLAVLALDYDGTLSSCGALEPALRQAIANLRAKGIAIIIVTGRILEDLRNVVGDLHFADGIVAENGALIHFPSTGYSRLIARPIGEALTSQLQQQGINFRLGQAILETDSKEACCLVSLIRQLELPLALTFNRSRVMVASHGVSKAAGLREALTILRLSMHDSVGIGDAENDFDLLSACEVGVAVAWGSNQLKAAADFVVPGSGPLDLVPFFNTLGRTSRLPAVTKTQRQLLLGYTDSGQALQLAVHSRNVLIAGDSRSGKSWAAGLLCEQLIVQGYSLCIFDPEGDYLSLDALPGVTVFGGSDPIPRPRDLQRMFRHPDRSAVIDLSHISHGEKVEYTKTVLPALAKLRQTGGFPHRIVVDEAHYFLHDPDLPNLVDIENNGYTFITYRASQLSQELLNASSAIVVTRESNPVEIRSLMELCQGCEGGIKEEAELSTWAERFSSLVLGEALVLPVTEEAGGTIQKIRLAPRLTPHVRHFSKYVDMPVVDSRAFVFASDGGAGGNRVRTLREFAQALETLPGATIEGHLRRHDFSRWISEVFGDYPPAKQFRSEEDRLGTAPTALLATAIREYIQARYNC